MISFSASCIYQISERNVPLVSEGVIKEERNGERKRERERVIEREREREKQ